MISKISKYDVQETMNRFEKIVKDKGFNIVARVDHEGSATKIGETLRSIELLIFGNPQLGSKLMQSNQTIGIDLPIKVLVWEDEGVVSLSYTDPAWLKGRYGINDRDKVFQEMTSALNAFSDAAVK